MPRKINRKNKWSDEQLKAAVEAVNRGDLKPHGAAVKFGVPSSTLYDHLKGKSQKRYGGQPTVLSNTEEKEIVRICEILQEYGFPLTKDIVGGIIRDYLRDCERPNPFRDSVPQYDWWCGFFKWWPELRERKLEHLTKCRAQGARPEVNKQQ